MAARKKTKYTELSLAALQHASKSPNVFNPLNWNADYTLCLKKPDTCN